MSTPLAEDAGLVKATRLLLVLQRRIPETHSATPNEHQWHDMLTSTHGNRTFDVTAKSVSFALDQAAILLANAPERDDTIYRVILRESSINERMIRL